MPADWLWDQAGLADLDSDLRPPADEPTRARLRQDAGTYVAALESLHGEFAELTGHLDAAGPGLARRGRQVIIAFGQRRAYPLSRDTVDRLGELYASLLDIVTQLRTVPPAHDPPPQPPTSPAAAPR